jgi:uncharacterized membrane-anchored protein
MAVPEATPHLPADHAQRGALNDEVHARPPEPLRTPTRVSYFALFGDAASRAAESRALGDLVARFGVAPPPDGSDHFRADLGACRLKWERHLEFSRYTFVLPGDFDAPFGDAALDSLPREWLAALSGQLLVAAHVAIRRPPAEKLDPEELATRFFAGNPLVGGAIAGGAASAYTDFRIHPDRFSRILVYDRGMTPRQAGRMVQRLLEIESYRMLALLALPLARTLAPQLGAAEDQLADITRALTDAGPPREPVLLEQLTRLEAEVERWQADHQGRFAAAEAYHALVQRRITELREEGEAGLQTFREFTERRLAPAMDTCRATAARLEALSRRVARASQLLSTRIEITRERQNQQLLESMDRRAELQLHLQTTVEGLSVAAITYYVVGLLGYAAKGLHELGLPADPTVVTAISIPVVAVVVALGVRRIRRLVQHPKP